MNTRQVWKGIKSLINTKGANDHVPEVIKINNEQTTDPSKIANEFNDYFSNIAENTKAKIPNTNCNHKDFLKNPNNCSIFLNDTTPTEILNLIY